MRDFTFDEIKEIHTRITINGGSGILQLEEILLSEEYSECQFYAMFSKIPMDDWDYEGAYFFKEDAMKNHDKVVAKWGMPGLGVNISYDPIGVQSLKAYDPSLRSKYVSSLYMEYFFDIDKFFNFKPKS
ncbi:MAG: hypothetical protein KBB11_11875 [Bacteroidales bacterium]|nr:hypothetical protein [Bacteroidales bacterium]